MAITDKVKEKLENVTDDMKQGVDSLKQDVREIRERIKTLASGRPTRTEVAVRSRSEALGDPFLELQRRTNQLFEDFLHDFGWLGDRFAPVDFGTDFSASAWPRLDVSETDKELVVKAELPGVDREDISVNVTDETLTISGRKKIEEEDKGKNYHRIECFHGSFVRTLPLPTGVDGERAEAAFKKQVLTVTIPKTRTAALPGRRIEIQ
ncbi:MAG: Hsp20/alpha crystallin family protein [Proteobacteria bacterium]|nr:Hsp20/alpha crystallin family protein [Pseudomonadota bacterium]